MGVVYKAEDTKLRRTVALKFLAPELTRDEDAKKRFVHEAQAASALDHPNICSIFDIDETPEGQLYIAMACYEGESLKDRIARRKLDVREAFEIAYSVAQGLARAHAGGIVHRDIKPGNIMITSDGFVKIVDFGLAKLIGRSRITGSGATLGTIAYMSPEQARSEDSGVQADIWALGVVLYEMVTGRLPFRGEIDQAVVYSILNEDPTPVRELRGDLPEACAAIIAKCMQKEPEQRYASALEFCSELIEMSSRLGWTSFSSGAVRAVSVVSGGRRKRRKKTILIAAAAALVVLAAFAWYRWEHRSIYTTDIRLAVMPFERIGETPSQAYLSGLSWWVSDVYERLSTHHESMWTVPYAMVFKDRPADTERARDSFGVNYVVMGSVQAFAGGHRLTLEIVDVESNRRSRKTYVSLDMDSASSLEDSLTIAALSLLELNLGAHELNTLVGPRTRSPEVFERFLIGCGNLLRSKDEDTIELALANFQGVVRSDSMFTPAWIGLGKAELAHGRLTHDAHALERSRNALNRALSIDSTSIDAWLGLSGVDLEEAKSAEGFVDLNRAQALDPNNINVLQVLAYRCIADDRFDEAEAYLRRALEKAPDYAPLHSTLGWLYRQRGQGDDELASALRATELAPRNLYALNLLGACYYSRDDFSRARECWERAFLIEPDCANTDNLALVLYFEGRFEESARYYEYGIQHCDSTHYEPWAHLGAALYWSEDGRERGITSYRRAIRMAEAELARNPDDGRAMAFLADYYAMVGDTDRAQAMISRASAYTSPIISIEIASAYAKLGNQDLAFQFAGDAIDRGYPVSTIQNEPLFRDLVRDPRFQKMVEMSKGDSK